MPFIFFIIVSTMFALAVFGSDDVKEALTKVSFPGSSKNLKLCGVGCRSKQIGPINAKVYAAGLYVDRDALKKACLDIPHKDSKKFTESKDLENALINGKFDKTIVLKMVRSVGTSKMVEALSESVKPRMNGQDSGGLASFKLTLERALDPVGGCKDGTILKFDSIRNSKLKVSVNGALKGAIDSPVLCNALVSVYVDKNTVSPSLKSNIGKTVFSWL